jgi:hypothetical protein
MVNAPLQPAMDQHVTASIVAAQTASASRPLTEQDSAVPMNPALHSPTVFPPLTVCQVRSALLALAVGEMFVWDHVAVLYAGRYCLVVAPSCTPADRSLHETAPGKKINFYGFIHSKSFDTPFAPPFLCYRQIQLQSL